MGVTCRPGCYPGCRRGRALGRRARRRALAAWAGAAGFGLVAWGLGAEAPTRAEAEKNMEEQKELLRQRGAQVPATAGTQTGLSRRSLYALDALVSSIRMVVRVRSGLRRPRQPSVLAIADEAPAVVFYALRAARAVQQRRPRIAAGLSPGRSRSGSPAAGSIG